MKITKDRAVIETRKVLLPDARRREVAVGAHSFSRAPVEPVDEYGELAEHTLLCRCQELVRPVDRRPQCLLAFRRGTANLEVRLPRARTAALPACRSWWKARSPASRRSSRPQA